MTKFNNLSESSVAITYGKYTVDAENDYVVLSCDEGFTKITGYTNEDFKNRDIIMWQFILPQDLDEYLKLAFSELEKKNEAFLKHRQLCKDGTVICVLCFGKIVTRKDETGSQHNYIEVMIVDYTKSNILEEYCNDLNTNLEALQVIVPGGVALFDIDAKKRTGRITSCNNAFLKTFEMKQYSSEDNFIELFKTLVSNKTYGQVLRKLSENFSSDSPFNFQIKLNLKGKDKWLDVNAKKLSFSDGIYSFCFSVFDVTEQKLNEMEIAFQNARYKLVAESSDESFFDYDIKQDSLLLPNGMPMSKDKKRVCLFNFFANHKTYNLIHPDDIKKIFSDIDKLIKAKKKTLQIRIKKDEENYEWFRVPYIVINDEDGEPLRILGRIYSVAKEIKLQNQVYSNQKIIDELSSTDRLTGLVIRTIFKTRVAQELKEKNFPVYAMIYLDINDFSYINDNFGYDEGDKMLIELARKIKDSDFVRHVSRINSDYFVALMGAYSKDEIFESITNFSLDFSRIAKERYPTNDTHLSVGVYFFEEQSDNITIAFDNANLARRSVKGNKEVIYCVYTEEMREKRSREKAITNELHTAIEQKRIKMFLQPKFDMKEVKIIGAEALVRWQNPDGSYKYPGEFIDILEKYGYITDLDFCIYEQLLEAMSRWKKAGKKLIPISANFSRVDIFRSDFVERINSLATKYGVDKNLIEIELTETAFSQNAEKLLNSMKNLSDLGFKIDIDDFGTGYSSLSILKDAPVDVVKIDKAFIDDVETSESAKSYIKQIGSLVSSTRKTLLFEGIETQAQADFLIENGYTNAQGWLYSKAIPLDEFEQKYIFN